jgi:hypothetical protein
MASEEMILDTLSQVETKLPPGWKIDIAEGSRIRAMVRINGQIQIVYYHSVSAWTRLIYLESRTIPNIDSIVRMITNDVYDKYINAATDYVATRMPKGYMISLNNKPLIEVRPVDGLASGITIARSDIKAMVQAAFEYGLDPYIVEETTSGYMATFVSKASQALHSLKKTADPMHYLKNTGMAYVRTKSPHLTGTFNF